MKNKTMYILSSVIIAVSIAVLLVFLCLPKTSPEEIKPLNCSVDNIELEVGQTKTDFYQISHKEASISFTVDIEGVIEIDEEKVVGLSAGSVNVEMTISLDQQNITETFKVVVKSNQCSIAVHSVIGGEIVEDNLYMSDSSCQFGLTFYDQFNVAQPNVIVVATASGDGDIQKRFGVYVLTASENCTVTFSVETYSFTKTINVIVD